ncbi:hypothetical protein EDF46_0095 [Frondihabitans sp. PhB188]|uniref:hypothetical protein n=1 Tax=Frondihabitans sp. PhB188 TaxID=2485200 RepID=UPI000F48BFBC|nr:hypothetical protein [Frondihabitans sp. PhB188]ROQ40734.1 hypothetical protein EDF46_0095 [Frondihabitans sp. PhB188]
MAAKRRIPNLHPWWRVLGGVVALALAVAAIVMFALHEHDAQKVFDVGALVGAATAVSWAILRHRYEPPDDEPADS